MTKAEACEYLAVETERVHKSEGRQRPVLELCQPSLSAALAFRELISPSAASQESVPLSHNPLRPRTDFREEKRSSFRRRLLGDRLPHPPGPPSASHLEESSSLLGLPQVSESKFNQRGAKVQKQRETVKEDKNNDSLVIRHLMRRADSLEKTLMLRGIGGRRRRGREEEMAGWRHWLHGHGFGWTPGVGDGQGGLECCDSWGHKEPDTTERLNWPELRPKTKSRIFGSSSRAIDNILSHILGLFCRH